MFGVIERGSGRAHTEVVPDARADTLRPIIMENVDPNNTVLMTDGRPAYRSMGRHLSHQVIDHELEYTRGPVHTQNIVNYWSIFKRGLYGVYHQFSDHRLPMYLHEFDFRAGSRRATDGARFQALLGKVQGRVTWYCRTLQPVKSLRLTFSIGGTAKNRMASGKVMSSFMGRSLLGEG